MDPRRPLTFAALADRVRTSAPRLGGTRLVCIDGPAGSGKTTFAGKARFTFKSSEPGSSFRCKVDGKAWKRCTSPFTVTVKPGQHTFRVQATDAAGNTDPTPAVWKWRVKRR